MGASDELLTLAELAVGLAGFAGVVVAFAYHGELEAIDRLRFIGLFTIAISTAVFAFVPFAFSYINFSEAATWRCSSAAFLGWGIAFTGAIGPPIRRTALETNAAIPRPFVVAVLVLGILNAILQLLNAIGSPFAPGPLPYIAGLLIWIIFAALFFAFLVLFRPTRPAA
jgi:hypothetical protein